MGRRIRSSDSLSDLDQLISCCLELADSKRLPITAARLSAALDALASEIEVAKLASETKKSLATQVNSTMAT